MGELLNIFACSITEWAKEGEDASGEDNDDNDKTEGGVDAEDKKKTKKVMAKQATSKMLATIVDNYGDVLAFLQAVAVKSPQVTASPLSLRAEKRVHV